MTNHRTLIYNYLNSKPQKGDTLQNILSACTPKKLTPHELKTHTYELKKEIVYNFDFLKRKIHPKKLTLKDNTHKWITHEIYVQLPR